MRLEDRVALVTGTASGIGRASMERFLREGARVVGVDLNPAGEKICEALASQGYPVKFLCRDVGELDGLPSLVDYTVEQFGRLDILVNNVGVDLPCGILDVSPDDFHKVQRINLESAYFLSQAAAGAMKLSGYGRIVNVASIQSFRVAPGSSIYNASKGALVQATRSFAVELAEYGILVNAVAPGVIRTGMTIIDGVDETETELFREVYIKYRKIPVVRAGEAEEVAASILFFASEDCRYVTGQVLAVDGGLTCIW